MPKTDPPQRLRHELRRPQSPGPVAASGRPAWRLQGPRLLDRAGASCSSAAASTGSSSPTCSASTTSTAAAATAAIRHGARRSRSTTRLLLVPAMAAVTEHLGFGFTAVDVLRAPVTFARRMSTLDHLTKGRVGWNIVTSYLDAGARNLGPRRPARARRALRRRRRVPGGLLQALGGLLGGRRGRPRPRVAACSPTRARSTRSTTRAVLHGARHPSLRAVAAAHAGDLPGRRVHRAAAVRRRARRGDLRRRPDQGELKATVARHPRRARGGRPRPDDAKIYTLLTVIIDETDAKAQAKHDEYLDATRPTRARSSLGSGWMGIDLSPVRPRRADRQREDATRCSRPSRPSRRPNDEGGEWTGARHRPPGCGIGGLGPVIVGSGAAGRRRAAGVGRGDRRRRLQPRLRHHARAPSTTSSSS